jgi:HEAT repeat protein
MRFLALLFRILVIGLIDSVLPLRATKDRKKESDVDVDDPAVVDRLLEEADEGDFEIRQGAVYLLGKSKDLRALPKLVALLTPSDDSEDPKGDEMLRYVAAEALGDKGEPGAIEPLISALQDTELASAAARALAKIEGALPVIIEKLSHKRAEVRRAAVRGLGAFSDEAVLEPLRTALSDRSKKVRQEAAVSFGSVVGRLPDEAIKKDIQRALETTDAVIRAAIVNGLAHHPSSARLAAIRTALDDDDVSVRLAAVFCLERYPVEPKPSSGCTSEDMLDLIEKALRDSDAQVRSRALVALQGARNERAGEMARMALADSQPGVRSSAAWALETLKYEPALPELVEAMRDRDGYVRRSAARALGMMGAVEAMDSVAALLDDPDWQVRESAATAIGEIWKLRPKAPRTAEPKLMEMLRDEYARVRAAADFALDHC